jgi:hypothetical protein
MSIPRRSFLLLCPGLLAAAAALGAAPPPASDSVRAQPEDLTHWEWYHEVRLPEGKGPLGDFILPPSVFGRSRPEQHDLRLVDAAGQTVPYALRVRAPRDEQVPIPGRTFNQGVNDDRSATISIDLGEGAPQHNEIAVEVGGDAYGRPLLLEGSGDNRTWSRLLDRVYVVRLEVDGKPVEKKRFSYPPSRFRYLRVVVRPDRVLEKDEPHIQSVQVYHTVRVPGEMVTLDARVEPREPVRLYGEYGSAWVIDLGDRNVPVERLSLQIKEPTFSRMFSIELMDSGESGPPGAGLPVVQTGELHGKEGEPIEVDLQRSLTATRLRLTIQDARNPPLTLTGVRFTAAAHEVIFPLRPGWKLPLRLYHGNPDAPAPRYDFAHTLPPRLDTPPLRATLGDLEKNPQYVPPPKAWTERWPYLVDTVLAVACAVLLGILAVLGRAAIRRHDSAAAPAT